jgi:hypothetical protein
VEYEDLNQRPGQTLRRITEFLEVDPVAALESPFRKASPDDPGDLVLNFDELREALSETPWAIGQRIRRAA